MKCITLAAAILVSGGVLLAQNTPPAQTTAPAAATPAAATAQASATPAPAAAAATPEATPVPSGEPAFAGYVDIGYRWVGTGGSFNTYRSIVDLGSGVKLLGTEFTILNSSHRFFDRIDVRATDWGDDPYSTLHIGVHKAHAYDFSGDYRNLAYYNNLPAFADPLLSTGVVLNEQALDIRKKIGDYRLDLLPGHTIMPYLEYNHLADTGNGIATFVADANEYPVYNLVRNSEENYRGGVRLEFRRFHAHLEQGGTTFKDDEQLTASGYTNYGNFFSPVIGQTLYLSSLAEGYGVRGHSVYSDASFSANPVSWADIYGTFLYSEPVSNVNFQGVNTGNQILFSQLLFYTGEQNLITSVAKLPHTSANLGAEIRPFSRLRLIPSWFTDRMHTTGSSNNQDTLATATGPLSIPTLLSSTLVENSNQGGMNAFFDVFRGLTFRAGYQYVWGNASNVILPIAGLTGFEQGKIRSAAETFGLAWHPIQKAWVNIDFENGTSGSTYFRTSLYDYRKARLRGRHQISNSLSMALSAAILSNQNPSPGINYTFHSDQESLSLQYTPDGGKLWDFEGAYTHSSLRSDIGYLDPGFGIPELSRYRDNSHTVSAMFDLNLPGPGSYKAKLAFGGSAFLSSGSNPTTFYQPVAKLSIVLRKHVSWLSEWRYYGFSESFYLYQGFRTEMFTTGLRITR
jgi:hypothetical protein